VRWDLGYCGHLLAYYTSPGCGWLWRNWWNDDLQGKPKYSDKTCPSATLSTTNPTWIDPGLNPGRRGRKPATNRLSYIAGLSLDSYYVLEFHEFLIYVYFYSDYMAWNESLYYVAASIVNYNVSTGIMIDAWWIGEDLEGSGIGLKGPRRAKTHRREGSRCLKRDTKRAPREHRFKELPLNQSFR
jgi:hypothetical protein